VGAIKNSGCLIRKLIPEADLLNTGAFEEQGIIDPTCKGHLLLKARRWFYNTSVLCFQSCLGHLILVDIY
jgi:hypothetical protein